MPRLKAVLPTLVLSLLSIFTQIADAAPKPRGVTTRAAAVSSSYWLANIERSGTVAFGDAQSSAYPVYRDVTKYGAVGKSSHPCPVLTLWLT